MILIRIFRYFCGYVIFTGKKGFPERFINLCSQNNLNIWDVKCSNGILTAKTDTKAYKRMRHCARKAGMILKIERKCGFPFFIRPYLRRKGLFVGAAVSLMLLTVLNSMIWTVDVSGNKKFTDEQIKNIAADYGVHPGIFRNSVDKKELQAKIKTNTDGINWFAVNIDGSRLFLEVSENEGSNEIIDTETPCNIVSGVDGELLKLNAHLGDPEMSIGSAVLKGDLLISGVKEKQDGTPYFVHARGTAVIRCKKQINKRTPKSINVKKINEIKKHRSVYIFAVRSPSVTETDKEFFRSESRMLEYKNVTLPIGIKTDTYFGTSDEKITLTQSEAAMLCTYSAFISETKLMKNSETESKKVTLQTGNNSVSVTAAYINHEETGIEQKIDVHN